MAKLYPESIKACDSVPESEKQVFELLKSLDDSYHVFHSLTWSDGRDGECDFIIFNELKGFIALEVKGGKIDYDGYSWRSTDGGGIVHEIKDPAAQARGSMRAVIVLHRRPEELNDRARYLSDELVYVGMSRARHLLYVVNVEG